MYRVSANDFYFPLVIALLKVTRRFPPWLRRATIRAVSTTAYLASRRKRRTTFRALDAGYGGELNAAQKRNIAMGAFYQFWRETFWLAPSPAELKQIATIPLRGEEHLRLALSGGKGVILLESNSFGSRIVARRVLHAHGYAVIQVHAKRHLGSGFRLDDRQWDWATRRFRNFFERCEMESLAEIIYLPASDSLAFIRVLLDRLKKNFAICIAGDGGQSQRLIRLPFLGVDAPFSTGVVNLARTSGAPILPLFCVRNRDSTIEMIIEAAIDVESAPGREASLIAGMRQCVAILERYSRMYPEQYYAWSMLARNRLRHEAPR